MMETKRKEIEEIIKKNDDTDIFKCNKCDNLSLDNKDWIIYLETPKRDISYLDSICYFCKTYDHGKNK